MKKYREFRVVKGTRMFNQVIKKLETAKELNITPQWYYDSEPMVIKDIVLTSPDTFVICLES